MKETTSSRLKQLMKERNLRQVDIVRLCEPYCAQYNLRLSKSDLSQFISGKVTPSQWKISILSHGLDVSEAWLMGFDVPKGRERDEQRVRDSALVMLSGINAGEADLVNLYRQLNQLGQLELKHYAEYLINKSEYQAAPPVVSVS